MEERGNFDMTAILWVGGVEAISKSAEEAGGGRHIVRKTYLLLYLFISNEQSYISQ
jgi:hypothetical protein